jgi:hypothetical protein
MYLDNATKYYMLKPLSMTPISPAQSLTASPE